MANTVKIRNSSTAAAAPSSLQAGELAINTADGTLFWEDSSGSIQTTYLLPSFDDLSSTAHASTHATGGSDALTPADIGAAPAASPTFTGNATFSASSGVPVTITNTGTGNSFVVNDASGDTTPFVVDAAGWVGVGVPVPLAPLNVISANSATAQELQRWAYFANNDVFNLRLTQTVTQGVVRWTWNQTNNSTDYPNVLCFDRGNVGINTTSPASRLDVNGVITVSAGSAVAPALVATGDANTGVYFPTGGDRFAISTGGVERLRVNHVGYVGINNISPVSTLDVNGVITVSAGSAVAPALVASGDANTGAFFPAADTFAISTAGTERLRVQNDGKVSIGNPATQSSASLLIRRPQDASAIIRMDGAAPTAAGSYYGVLSSPTIAGASNSTYSHFTASESGTGDFAVSYGFLAGDSLSGTTAARGFMSSLSAGTGRWNIYSSGTAPNYFAGQCQFSSGSALAPAVCHAGDTNTGLFFDTDVVSISTDGTERLRVNSAGLDISSDKIRLRTAKTPASSSDTGNAGDICWDSSYLYICTATDTWRRIPHSTW